MLLNPKKETFEQLDPVSRDIMTRTVGFFEEKGKRKLKHDDRMRVWYADLLSHLKENRVFARLLTPPDRSEDPDARWDTWRNCAFNEVLGFYGLHYWYTWQVTILGLGPLWMSRNEAMQKRTAQALENGGIFGFGLSEKSHGADLYATDMMLTPTGPGKYMADGGKYYIGNANEAAWLSVFGRDSETDEFVFFAVDPKRPEFDLVQNVVNSQSYVAEFALRAYPVSEAEVLSRGQDAWDAALNTVNIGKFNLGWASIGICTHAFYEALNHATNRVLYKTRVVDFPHIRQLFADAYSRLLAMRLFAMRASDYMRSASGEDRRYLLFNPMVKMKVTMQGEEVINALWDVIAAKGFERDMYFEMAARDIRALPKLEGTVHVNMALVVKFMKNYFFLPEQLPEIPLRRDAVHDAFLFDQGPTRGLSQVRFHDYRTAYHAVDTPNVARFREQVKQFKRALMQAPPNAEQSRDVGFLFAVGELFSCVVYGQLILEQCKLTGIPLDLVDQMFDFMVRDFSTYALRLYHHPLTQEAQAAHSLEMMARPDRDQDRFQRVLRDHITACAGAYEMAP